jgi:hypothetical protein
VYDRLPIHPSLVDDLLARDISFKILHDYMRPTFRVSAHDANQRIYASFPLDASGGGTLLVPRICAQRVGPHAVLSQIQVGADLNPILSTSLTVVHPAVWTCFAKVQAQARQGWVGTHVNHTAGTSDCPVEINAGGFVSGTYQKQTIRPTKLTAYASVHYLGATTAVETTLPLDHGLDVKPHYPLATKTYFHMDLSGEGPPIRVSLYRDDVTSAASVSQILYFDRYQFNPAEDRSDTVRNAAAWTVRLARRNDSVQQQQQSATSATASSSSVVQAAGQWQINRGVAVKAAIDTDLSVTGAIILKRWKQPRIACSFLFSNKSFLGIGFELETGTAQHVGYLESAEYVNTAETPETRAVAM